MFLWRPRVIGAVLTGFGLLVAGSAFAVPGQTQPRFNGKELFEKRCGGCHALNLDKEGPRLRGVYGRVAGSVDSFQYSEALRKSKIVWNDEFLQRWLTGPEQLVPGNDMAFHLENAGERREIIAYLKQSSGK